VRTCVSAKIRGSGGRINAERTLGFGSSIGDPKWRKDDIFGVVDSTQLLATM
jgi:hypothetical protein